MTSVTRWGRKPETSRAAQPDETPGARRGAAPRVAGPFLVARVRPCSAAGCPGCLCGSQQESRSPAVSCCQAESRDLAGAQAGSLWGLSRQRRPHDRDAPTTQPPQGPGRGRVLPKLCIQGCRWGALPFLTFPGHLAEGLGRPGWDTPRHVCFCVTRTRPPLPLPWAWASQEATALLDGAC